MNLEVLVTYKPDMSTTGTFLSMAVLEGVWFRGNWFPDWGLDFWSCLRHHPISSEVDLTNGRSVINPTQRLLTKMRCHAISELKLHGIRSRKPREAPSDRQ